MSSSCCKVSCLICFDLKSLSLVFCSCSSNNFLSRSIMFLSINLSYWVFSLSRRCMSCFCWLSIMVTSLCFCFRRLSSPCFFFMASKSYKRVRIDHSSMFALNLILLWAFLFVVVIDRSGEADGNPMYWSYCYCWLISWRVTYSGFSIYYMFISYIWGAYWFYWPYIGLCITFYPID